MLCYFNEEMAPAKYYHWRWKILIPLNRQQQIRQNNTKHEQGKKKLAAKDPPLQEEHHSESHSEVAIHPRSRSPPHPKERSQRGRKRQTRHHNIHATTLRRNRRKNLWKFQKTCPKLIILIECICLMRIGTAMCHCDLINKTLLDFTESRIYVLLSLFLYD